MNSLHERLLLGVATLLLPAFLSACGSSAFTPSPARTSLDITPADSRTRIYLVADDSMQGRRAGTIGNYKMTSYIEHELSRFGLEPAGERGTFYQVVPMVRREIDTTGTAMSVGVNALKLFDDFAPLRPNTTERYGVSLESGTYPTVYGGRAGDSTASLPPADVTGRIVILEGPLDALGQPTGVWATPGAISVSRFPTAAGIAIASLDLASTAAKAGLHSRTNAVTEPRAAAPRPMGFVISAAAAKAIMGDDLGSLRPGAKGRDVTARVRFIDQPVDTPARNVIAILRGSDPILRSEYVAIGAHTDHVGIAARAVDHDSLRAWNTVMRPQGAQSRGTQPANPTTAQLARIRSIRDSILRIRPPRLDSINNGADDDGSGSVALLEIAEYTSKGARPKRSILFVFHTAEESGLLGSAWFTENPTVPRETIVAQLNMDMVGRGGANDIAGGGPRYLQVIGSRRLSNDFGNVIDSVNAARREPMLIDYSWDAAGHIMNRYCRSDHYNYARRGIPIAFISRGYGQDYHVVTDEPQYIDYDGVARVAGFVRDVATAVANRSDRVHVDKVVPDPLLPCRQ